MKENGAQSVGNDQRISASVSKQKRDIFSYFLTITIPIVLIFLLSAFVVRPTDVRGQSMENTCHNGDILLMWELNYHPQKGDIVVINDKNPLGESLVKRVIGVAADKIKIDGSNLWVNGEKQSETYLKESTWKTTNSKLNFTIPQGQVFVMGDNRNHSTDSRQMGTISENAIMGKAIIRFFPFSRIGKIQ